MENKYNNVLLQGRLRQKKYYLKNRDIILARRKKERQDKKHSINNVAVPLELKETESYHIKETEEEKERLNFNGIRSRFFG